MSKQTLIQPRTLSGFRDYPPPLMIPRERLLETIRRVYRSYGFAPIDTPALEYTEILLGKGGTESDKLMYRFHDNGGRDVSMRFDLTVPFARFAAQHINDLGTPFKRYHMGPVWRGERAGHGRYREFWQCDFDTIGTTSNAADIETVLVIHDLFVALGFEKFTIHVNNRMVLNGLLQELELQDKATPVLRSLDKLAKVGRDAVIQEMISEAEVTQDQAEKVMILAETQGNNYEILTRLEQDFGTNEIAGEGIRRLRELLDVAKTAGVSTDRIQIDVSIARGLDYYTGTIYETFLNDKPDIGSVCSGGRYDDLAGLYTSQTLPGVGASLGLDRLLAAMEELGMLGTASTPAPVLIVQFAPELLGQYQAMARQLREAGIGTEVYPDRKKVPAQFKYAERRGFQFALIAGQEEFDQGIWKIKILAKREELTVKPEEVLPTIQGLLEA